jgi:hypothetical protein
MSEFKFNQLVENVNTVSFCKEWMAQNGKKIHTVDKEVEDWCCYVTGDSNLALL